MLIHKKTTLSFFFNFLAFVVLTSMLVTTVSAAEPANAAANLKQNIASIGITYDQMKQNVDIVIDQRKTIAALPTLTSHGLISNIAPNDIATAPLSLSVALIGISFTVVIIDSIFSHNNDLDSIHVQTYVLPAGSQEKKLCYSFDYSRAMYEKMDMDNLTPKAFMLNTPSFTFSPWCKENMDKENSVA